jgi:trimethylamine--corrinoid protein Co-methyltransferase
MTLASMSLLSRDDIEKVHDASLRVLSDVGVMVESASVRDLFRKAGAVVDDSRQLVKLDERLVRSSLESAPRKISICSRGGRDHTIPEEGVQLISTDGQPPAIFDAETGEKRKSTLADLRELIVLADALPEVDFVWPPVVATDMPSDRSSFYEFLVSISCTSKHIQHGAASEEEARFQIEVCSAILGSEEELRRRPIFSDVCTPISPLRYDAGEAEALVTLSRAGIPVINLSMAIAGAVTPASVAGSLAVINAENLCGLTMTQLAAPGAPSVYSSFSGVMDLRSGVFLCGTPEGILMDSAATVMGRHYGLPTCAGGPSNAARSLSSEAGLETALTAASAMLIGADMMVGLGGIDRAGMISKEKIIMDCELLRWLRHLRRGIDLSDQAMGLDAISRQGPGGTFLSDAHTARFMRKELMIPQVTAYHANREPDRREDEMVSFAVARAKELLSSHKVLLLDEEVAGRVGDVAKRYGIVAPDGSQVFEHSG